MARQSLQTILVPHPWICSICMVDKACVCLYSFDGLSDSYDTWCMCGDVQGRFRMYKTVSDFVDLYGRVWSLSPLKSVGNSHTSSPTHL